MRDITFNKRLPSSIITNTPKMFNVYLYLIFFFIIFSSGAILDQKYFNFSQMIVLGLCMPIFFLSKNFNYKQLFFLTLVIPFYLVINFINYDDTIINYLLFIIKFIFIFFLVRYCIIKKIDILKIFNNLIIGICIYSIFSYVLLDIMKILPYFMEVINEKPYKVFLGFHFHWQEVNWFSWRVVRNNSIFWEPGVFQIYISFSLFYQLFIKEKFRKSVLILLVLNMFTTFSTTGFLIVLTLLTFKYLKQKPKTNIGMIFKIYIVPIIIITAIIIGLQIFNQKVNNGTVSYDLRTNDLNIGMDLFFQKPFFGWGYLNNNEFKALTGTSNNSNGLVSMMFHQGIMGLLFYTLPIFVLILSLYKNKGLMVALSFGVFYFVSAATEPLMYANFFNVFISMGFIALFERKLFYSWTKKEYALMDY
ncbi:O-antigen ligase family protein [Guptibacillus sedimenti]|uniref:O-antigen ligase family protein n=1 Tax=Guptibacillus sedimenti TaxID=3025680 RepID=UPI00235EA512|nr:O-antigen ligase family protein [Pseudalkalibacillus sedimenti]